jgi:localization factor PodJL
MSVGEWLNRVIQNDDEDRRPSRSAASDRDSPDEWRRRPRRDDRRESPQDFDDDRVPRRSEGAPYRDEYRGGRDDRPRREPERDNERVAARARAEIRETARAEAQREAVRTREDIGEVHARLDRLSQQLERLAPVGGAKAARPAVLSEPSEQPNAPLTGAPRRRRGIADAPLSIEEAVAEITERQRALDGEAAAQPPIGVKTAVDFSGLENQLRQITARIEALQPANDIEKAIGAVRTDLADIGRQLTEALPRRAVESLEIEVKALAERIDHSRQSGVDSNALAGLEHGLAEVREALRGLTPAESLVGFDEAVHALAQKVDLIIAREDPTALQQLEAAIGGLRGVVSHVASNDTLTKVAEDVRMLASQVDGIANNAATGHAVSALEQRIDTLAAALTASSEAGHAVPRELEKLLAGLIEKLEWVQLTHTDHAALAHLEDRIATLVQRFDASDARLGHLEAIERGLADLLVHIEQMRGVNGTAAATPRLAPAAGHPIERDVAEIKQNERRTQDSLEAVHGAVEHVVDRLATIESGLRSDAAPRAVPAARLKTDTEAAAAPAQPVSAREKIPAIAAGAPADPRPLAQPSLAPPAAPRAAAARPPIDPNLPPDHPLEPGSAAGRSRAGTSAADRIAASEAAIGSAKPPVIADSGRPDFIAAARRAAQAAAWEPSGQESNGDAEAEQGGAQSNKLSQRLRKLIVAGGAVLILIGCARIGMRLFDDGGAGSVPQAQTERVSPPAESAQTLLPAKPASSEAPPLPPVSPALNAPPAAAPATAKAARPPRQSMLNDGGGGPKVITVPPSTAQPSAAAIPQWASPEITGALPPGAGGEAPPAPARSGAVVEDKLPATIGDPALRGAAMAGDGAAAYEVATRFAEGRGVTLNNEEAAHWFERAAKQGLAPAQFRLGGLYEKGIGVKKDLATARDLYLAAAEKGNGKAMHNLAVLYAEGVNGPPDYRNAAIWFRKAADHGIEDSQYNLAILYARGIGVEQNYAESYKWFVLAAKQGDTDAAKKRDEVAAHLDAQSLAAARLAVQNWSPEPQPEDAVSVKTVGAWTPPPKRPQAAQPKPHPAAASIPVPGLGSAISPD